MVVLGFRRAIRKLNHLADIIERDKIKAVLPLEKMAERANQIQRRLEQDV